jgi:hypothetical protein
MSKDQMIYTLIFVTGFLIGALSTYALFLPEVETVTEVREVHTTKTEYVKTPPEIIFLRSPRAVYLRDTVIQERVYPINRYQGIERTMNGSFTWTAHTSGFLNDINFKTDFQTKVITNTIERDKLTTITVIQKGVFAGGGVASDRTIHVGASYLGKNYIAGVDYSPSISGSQPVWRVGAKVNIFSLK